MKPLRTAYSALKPILVTLGVRTPEHRTEHPIEIRIRVSTAFHVFANETFISGQMRYRELLHDSPEFTAAIVHVPNSYHHSTQTKFIYRK